MRKSSKRRANQEYCKCVFQSQSLSMKFRRSEQNGCYFVGIQIPLPVNTLGTHNSKEVANINTCPLS